MRANISPLYARRLTSAWAVFVSACIGASSRSVSTALPVVRAATRDERVGLLGLTSVATTGRLGSRRAARRFSLYSPERLRERLVEPVEEGNPMGFAIGIGAIHPSAQDGFDAWY